MMKNKRKEWKRIAAFTLAALLMFNSIDLSVMTTYAKNITDTTNEEKSHTEHTTECGYVEAVEGHPCTHKHDDSCYAVKCIHEHDENCGYVEASEGTPCGHVHDAECGYTEAVEEVLCDCTDTDESGEIIHTAGCGYVEALEGSPCTHIHDDTCGYAKATEGTPCNHICSVENGCYELVCSHAVEGQHDDTCGYVEAVEGSPCKYEYEEEDTEEEDTEEESTENSSPAYTTEDVKAMLDALPSVSELEAMSEDERNSVYEQAQEASDAYEMLTEEQQTELSSEYVKLKEVLEYMAGLTAPAKADTSAFAPERYDSYEQAGKCIFANGTAITIEAASGGTVVWYMDGNTKKYVNANGANGEDLSDFTIFAGSNNADGMRGVNGSITMTGGTVGYIGAGQYYGPFSGTSNITITGGTVTAGILCNSKVSHSTGDKISTVTIFDAVGTTIVAGDGKADNVVQKEGDTWNVSGNGVIPSGVTLTVNAGETLNVPNGATLTNNGTLVNNGGMIIVYGKLAGNAPENYVAPSDFSFSLSALKANVSATLTTPTTSPSNTTLVPWFTYELVDAGTTEAVLNGTTISPYNAGTVRVKVTMRDGYCTPVEKTYDIPVSYTSVTGISENVPSEYWVNREYTLPTVVTPSDASYSTVTWSVVNAGNTGAVINGNKIRATYAGTATIRATVQNGKAYGSDFVQDYTVSFVAAEMIDLSLGSVTISKKDDSTLTVAYAGFSGGSKDYSVDEPITIMSDGTQTSNNILVKSGTPTLVLNDVNISAKFPLRISGDSYVYLNLVGNNTLTASASPGLGVEKNATVVIDGPGSLKATGALTSKEAGCAGIGGYFDSSIASFTCGTIIINGGDITAKGAGGGAGIGGAYYSSSTGFSVKRIEINGGTIKATGSLYGNSWGKSGHSIGVYRGSAEAIVFSGGTIIADSVGGSGLTVDSGVNNGENNGSQSVSLVTITLDGAGDGVLVTAVDNPAYYGVTDMKTRNGGKLYLYLPANTMPTSVTAGGVEYLCCKDNTYYTQHIYSGDCDDTCQRCGKKRDNPAEHDYENGICKNCGGYQSAVFNSNENYYEISNAGQLFWFAEHVNDGNKNANGKLMADIDVGEEMNVGIGTSSVKYAGDFDGNGHTLTIEWDSVKTYTAPFPYVNGATIKNLTVKGTIATNQKFAAGIVGSSDGTTTMENCLSDVTINSEVNGDGTHGGLVANVSSGTMTIKNCGFTGAINGSNTNNCGGFVGWSNGTTTISNSFVAATFGIKSNGGCTFSRGNNVTVTNSYYLNALGTAQGTQKSTEQFASGEVAWLLNGSSMEGVWKQMLGSDATPKFSGSTVYKTAPCMTYTNKEAETTKEHDFDAQGFCKDCKTGQPATEINGIYEISNAGQLFWFAEHVNDGNKNASGKLMADIDLTGKTWTTICETGLYYSAYGEDKGYAGTFDGNGHVIKNITIKSSVSQDASCGLFGTVSGTVKHLGIEGVTFIDGGKDIRAGAIVGQLITSGGLVEDCYVVNAAINPGEHVVGGISGCVYEGTIQNCYVLNSTIKGSNNRYGAIVGDSCGDNNNGDGSDRTGTVKNCYTDNSVVYSTRKGTISNCETKKTEVFKSGEVTYLLSNGVTDGTQVWYQTLESDTYPVFTGGTVYFLNEKYTNTPHTHVWEYTGSNNGTITATCKDADGNCENPDGGSLTLQVEDAYYTGNGIEATVTNKLTLAENVTYKVTYDEGETSAPNRLGKHTAILTVYENGTEKASVQKDYTISYLPAPEEAYRISNGYKDSNNTYWFKEGEGITVSAPYGYTIATSLGGSYGAEVTLSETDEKEIYLKKNDEMTDKVEITETFSFDGNAPDGKMEIEERGSWQKLWKKISFGLFYKGDLTAVITASDAETGVKSVEYYLADSDLIADDSLSDAVAISKLETAVGTNWKTYSSEIPLSRNAKIVIYAKITDNAGNVTYINSAGLVLYADAEADTSEITTTYHANADKEVKVVLNSNTIKSVANGDTILTPDTDYIVNDNIITLKAAYLDTLNAGDYTFTVAYHPLGVEYAEAVGNEAPETTTFKLSIEKVTPIIATVPSAEPITYGQTLADSSVQGSVYYDSTKQTLVAGSFVWKNGSSKPTAKDDSNNTRYTVVFKPTASDNYNEVETEITITVNKAQNAPNMPDSTMSVQNSITKVGDVTLPKDWVWQESDKDTALEVDVAQRATALYEGADQGNYEKESVEIILTRSACDHVPGEILYTGTGEYAPDCVNDGLGHRECTKCHAVTESGIVVAALGHQGGTATCKKKAVCTVCHQEYGSTNTDNHAATEIRGHKNAACTSDGYTGDTYCADCGTKLKSGTAIAALGHKYKSVETTAPTTTSTGVRTYTCERCGYSYTETIAKLPEETHSHSYTENVTRQPDCTNAGVKTYSCSCGDSYTESIPALGHHYISRVTKQATTTAEGIMTYTCDRCGHSYTRPIAKLSGNGQQGNTDKPDNNNPGNDNKPADNNKPGENNKPGDNSKPDTGKPYIEGHTEQNGWENIKDQLEKAKDKNTVTVEMNGTTVVPGDVFDSIRGKDVKVVFDLGDGITWTVNGKDITADKVGDIDFSVTVGSQAGNTIPVDIINNVTGERYSVNVTLAYDGEFGFTAILTLNVDKENAGLYANLFYYNPETAALEFMSAAQIDENGNAALEFTHASDYTVVLDTEVMSEEGTDDVLTDADENAAWNPLWVIVIGAVILIVGLGIFFAAKKKKEEAEK